MKLNKYVYAIVLFGLLMNIGFASAATTGGLGVAVLPKISSISLGSEQTYTIKIVNTQKVSDTVRVYLTNNGIPASYQFDLSWFDWSEKLITIPAGGTVTLENKLKVPTGINTGKRGFKVVAESSSKISAYDTGLITLTPAKGLITKDENIDLSILKNYNIPLENLIISTFLSEVAMVTGETTAKVIVADASKGQIIFISNPDGNPFAVAYIPASDIQNGKSTITLESIADGFIMVNPLMFGFKDSDRLAILAYAKNAPLYQDLKNEINVALQTEPNNLLEEAVFPNTYGDATLLIIDAIKNLGGEALSQAVVKEALGATPTAIIGQTNVPHLNDLGGGNIEAINPTMIFYGFNVAELPGQVRLIAGKESLWELNLNLGWPPVNPQFTDPIKETVTLGNTGHYNIAFSKFGLSDAAGKAATSANVLKSSCIILDVVFFCPASNKAIESAVEEGPLDDQTLGLIGSDIITGSPQKTFEVTTEFLTNKDTWRSISQKLYSNAVDKDAAISFLKGSKKVLKAAKVVVKVLNAYDAANVYIPFGWDLVTKPNNVKYCVTEANGVLSVTCQMIPPTAIITMTTPPDQAYVGKDVLFDASSSTDPLYNTGSLMVRWDFNNDGVYEADWSWAKTTSWIYNNEGIYDVILDVKNQDGLIGHTSHTVIINANTAGGTANHIKAFRDVKPWNTMAFETTMANNGYTEGTGEKQYEILPSTALATNLLTPGQDFVIIMNDQNQTFYNNLAASLPRLDRFIQNGGSVLWEASDLGWHGGSMATAGIQALPGGVQFKANYDSNNYNVNPTSTLMNGLPDVLYGSYASHEYFLNLPADATIYMKNTAGYPTLSEYHYGNGWMMLTGQPLEYNVVYNPDSMGLVYPRLFNYVLGQQVDQITQQQLGILLNQAIQEVPSSHKEN